jgi:glycosyltransferase involved in cell wall biosynthesis
MNKKRILIYIKDPKGGTGTFIKNICFILKKNNYDVLFVSHNEFNLNSIKQKNIGYYIAKQNSFSIKSLFYSFVNMTFFLKEVFIFKPKYIFSLDLYANITSDLLKTIFFPNITLINSTHINLKKHINFKRNKLFSSLLLFFVKWLYPKANLHITPSRELSLDIKKIINNNQPEIKTMYYPLNRKKIIKLSKQIKIKNKHTLTTFARLNCQKNVELLIESVIFFNNTNDRKISLQILGDGELEKKIKFKYKNNKSITLTGWKKNPFPYLLNTKIYILISKYEGFPYSILEAMALGKPIIVSDVDYGPREIIGKNQFGLLTNNTIENISEAISAMLIKKNFYKYKRQSIIRFKYFDQTKLNNQYLSLFKS